MMNKVVIMMSFVNHAYRKEIVEKINNYFEGKISDKDLDKWATQALVDYPENFLIEDFIIESALGLLNMLHDDDERFRASRAELEETKNILLGNQEFEMNRIEVFDFTNKIKNIIVELDKIIKKFLTRENNIDFKKLYQEFGQIDQDTLYGILIKQASYIIKNIEDYSANNMIQSTRQLETLTMKKSTSRYEKKLIKKLEHIYKCLIGQREIFFSIKQLANDEKIITCIFLSI